MKKIFLFISVIFISIVTGFGQPQNNNDDVKYVIFTSRNEAKEQGEGVSKFTPETKSDINKYPPTMFHFISKSREISAYANYFGFDLDKLEKLRNVTENDKLVIKEEPIEFLNTVSLIDMDVLFPKLTKDEFIKVWNSLWNKTVYFIDRSEIKKNIVKLYPVKVTGINLY